MSSAAQHRSVHGYTLLEVIGAGSFGTVWRALTPGNFPAAVKFISRARDDLMALPELKALESVRSLNSPFIVKVFGCWEEKDWLIIAMELGDGNLRERFDYCRQQGEVGIPADELLHYVRETADALDYLHGLNKLHRDIKPENLLLFLGAPAHCKVGDCGLVRDQDRVMTMRPQGSPPFMPPEAWDCRPCPASDQFSLAVTYAEMRLGRRPFTGMNVREIEGAVRYRDPDLEGLSEAEAGVLRTAMAKSPTDRYESCRDFVHALEEAMKTRAGNYRPKAVVKLLKEAPPASRVPTRESEKGTAPRDGSGEISTELPLTLDSPPPPHQTRRWPVALVAAVAVIMAVGLMARPFLFPPTPPTPPAPGPDVGQPPAPSPSAGSLHYPREVPPPPGPSLPPAYAVVSGADLLGEPQGPVYATRIVRRFGGEEVVMRLIPGPTPFYIMENKVWNGLFERFTRDNPGRSSDDWKMGGKANGADVGAVDSRHPALRTTRAEAEACAAWLGGRLPSAAQLDRAGPGRGGATGRRREGPIPVGTFPDDRGPLGVNDLAGNGWEWTRDTIDGGELAVLRGRSYAASGPPAGVTFTQFPWSGSPYTGFRVVIELSSP